ncbi:hypothetical protein NDU88_003836 [Pleurodeles waltl]|uniref:Uncharacterized protein n=1 Tax=Pleurodeles waltl TaxID=8319 RepID=A0AAV7MUL6_PLEWA|nr:hypothetical protein NDU88_003836 [Pleurodeles waltl]
MHLSSLVKLGKTLVIGRHVAVKCSGCIVAGNTDVRCGTRPGKEATAVRCSRARPKHGEGRVPREQRLASTLIASCYEVGPCSLLDSVVCISTGRDSVEHTGREMLVVW